MYVKIDDELDYFKYDYTNKHTDNIMSRYNKKNVIFYMAKVGSAYSFV